MLLLLTLLLLFPWPANLESLEEGQGDPYYGVPLGALHYSAEGTSAEVYAADEFSIIFNHFYHNPRENGCTAMMIGPPRPEDRENVVPGHGLILPLAHQPVAARHRARRRRSASTRTHQQFRGYWPVEFDHLLMGPTGKEGQKRGREEGQGQGRKGEKQAEAVLNRVNLSNSSVAEQLLQGNGGWALDSVSIPKASTFSPFNGTAPPSNVSSEPIASTAPIPSSSIQSPSTAGPSSPPPSTSSPAVPTQPLILLGGKRPTSQLVKMVVDSREGEEGEEGEGEEGHPLLRLKDAEIRRAPARHDANPEWTQKGNELEEKELPASTPVTRPEQGKSTTPLFRVIKDPREGRRQRLIELRKKLDPNYEPPTTSTTAAPFSPLEAQFELPRIRDKLATFALTNGAKITQYKWIGLWNQCTKRHIPLVSLRDVDPPREEKIMPLSGWSHNVTSYRLHILNCNTILIPSFHYDGRNTTRNTFFFVGVGQFPEAVEQQLKANLVGQKKGEPLRSYSGEDVLLRLPRPYRTFDVDFISIFNTDQQKSFGHVLIPSLLVPPCPDDE